ncbi:MAG: DUF4321 domain-containing protein [Velocimicrobium sp.]
MKRTGNNHWSLFLLILCGIVLGGFIGYLTKNISYLSWLDYGQTFGLEKPVKLDLGILILTFGLTIKISIASILGVLCSILLYRNL